MVGHIKKVFAYLVGLQRLSNSIPLRSQRLFPLCLAELSMSTSCLGVEEAMRQNDDRRPIPQSSRRLRSMSDNSPCQFDTVLCAL